ncbi:MAG: cytochrome c [Spirochaetia bacterium]|nr:cytochrome c [Spirochaetia bacterium]
MNKKSFFAISLIFVVLAGFSFQCGKKKKIEESIETGKNIYEANCSPCHGINGEGDGPGAAALNPKPRNYKKDGFKYGSSIEEVKRTISEGIEGTAMPTWAEVLTDDQITHVAEYVKSLAASSAE